MVVLIILKVALVIMSAITVADEFGINTRVSKKIINEWSRWCPLFFCFAMIDSLTAML